MLSFVAVNLGHETAREGMSMVFDMYMHLSSMAIGINAPFILTDNACLYPFFLVCCHTIIVEP